MRKYYLSKYSDTYAMNGLFIGFEKVNNPKDAEFIIFGGGEHVHPRRYNHKSILKRYPYNEDRDEYEFNLYDQYKDKKFIGICRGAQLGHVISGGFLFQNVDKHTAPHNVYTKDKLYKVTSTHQQAMGDKTIGDVLAYARTSTWKKEEKIKESNTIDIEAMFHRKTRFFCFQPHPEFSECYSSRILFFKLFNQVF